MSKSKQSTSLVGNKRQRGGQRDGAGRIPQTEDRYGRTAMPLRDKSETFAGRPHGAASNWVDPNEELDTTFSIEGTCTIESFMGDKKAARDRMEQDAIFLGLKPIVRVKSTGEYLSNINARKDWKHNKIFDAQVPWVVEQNPGATMDVLATILYKPKIDPSIPGHELIIPPWTKADLKHAVTKLYIRIGKFLRRNELVRRYRNDKAIFFVPEHPDTDKYAKTRAEQILENNT